MAARWLWVASLAAWATLFVGPQILDGIPLCGGGQLPPWAALDLLARTASLQALLLSTALMTFAMMLPLVGPSFDHVADRSGPRGGLAVASFLFGLLAVWMVALFALGVAALVLRSLPAAGWVAVGVALLWQEGWPKGQAHRRCHARPPLRWRAVELCPDCIAYGAATATRCVASCWAVMLAAMTVGGMGLMMVVTGVALVERRYARRPFRLSRLFTFWRTSSQRAPFRATAAAV